MATEKQPRSQTDQLNTMHNQMDQIEENHGKIWKPTTIGDELMGEIVSMNRHKSTKFDTEQTALVLKTSDDELRVYYCHGIVEAQIKKQNAKPGMLALLRYKGTKPNPDGGADFVIITSLFQEKEQ